MQMNIKKKNKNKKSKKIERNMKLFQQFASHLTLNQQNVQTISLLVLVTFKADLIVYFKQLIGFIQEVRLQKILSILGFLLKTNQKQILISFIIQLMKKVSLVNGGLQNVMGLIILLWVDLRDWYSSVQTKYQHLS